MCPRYRSSRAVSKHADGTLINAAINAVGITFGQALVERTALEWVIATDESGSDLALFALPGRGDVLVYPANFVAKRWERRESDFLEKSCEEIARTVTTVEKAHRRPWWRFWQARRT